MKNYIVINGVTYDLVERTSCFAKGGVSEPVPRLADLPVGETFKIGEYEMVVLEQSGDTTAVILKDMLIEKKQFGESNNYDGSYVDGECNEFAVKIAAIVGEKNLVEHTVDLTSDDGLKDYGKIRRKASLLTTELYRRYVYTLDKLKTKKWWWLATAYSTPAHEDGSWIKCVSPVGNINDDGCSGGIGVRPFCILKSHIFVSR